jgi:hypothetical protein
MATTMEVFTVDHARQALARVRERVDETAGKDSFTYEGGTTEWYCFQVGALSHHVTALLRLVEQLQATITELQEEDDADRP